MLLMMVMTTLVLYCRAYFSHDSEQYLALFCKHHQLLYIACIILFDEVLLNNDTMAIH